MLELSLAMLPLDVEGAVNMTKTLTDFASGPMAAAFANVGRGIGGIMLLIVALYYITSILDGGKFQIKMLLPLLIFILVCNFAWVASPVTSFTSAITSSLVESCRQKKYDILEKNGCSETATINDLNNAKREKRNDGEIVNEFAGKSEDATKVKDESDIETDPTTATEKNAGKEKWWQRRIKDGINSSARGASEGLHKELSGEKMVEANSTSQGWKMQLPDFSFQSIVSTIVSWICKIMSYVLSAFGAVMTGLIVAFGPITWGFAVFPGQGRTILSWFLRLCQFALWAPIVALIDTFSTMIFDTMASGSLSVGSVMMSICVGVCNLVALTSVPTIASMIIEGAQGAVSLSQGLQTMGGALTTGGTVAAAIGSGGATAALGTNKVQSIKDAVAGAKQGGVIGAVRDIGRSTSIRDLAREWAARGRNSREGNFGNYTG